MDYKITPTRLVTESSEEATVRLLTEASATEGPLDFVKRAINKVQANKAVKDVAKGDVPDVAQGDVDDYLLPGDTGLSLAGVITEAGKQKKPAVFLLYASKDDRVFVSLNTSKVKSIANIDNKLKNATVKYKVAIAKVPAGKDVNADTGVVAANNYLDEAKLEKKALTDTVGVLIAEAKRLLKTKLAGKKGNYVLADYKYSEAEATDWVESSNTAKLNEAPNRDNYTPDELRTLDATYNTLATGNLKRVFIKNHIPKILLNAQGLIVDTLYKEGYPFTSPQFTVLLDYAAVANKPISNKAVMLLLSVDREDVAKKVIALGWKGMDLSADTYQLAVALKFAKEGYRPAIVITQKTVKEDQELFLGKVLGKGEKEVRVTIVDLKTKEWLPSVKLKRLVQIYGSSDEGKVYAQEREKRSTPSKARPMTQKQLQSLLNQIDKTEKLGEVELRGALKKRGVSEEDMKTLDIPTMRKMLHALVSGNAAGGVDF